MGFKPLPPGVAWSLKPLGIAHAYFILYIFTSAVARFPVYIHMYSEMSNRGILAQVPDIVTSAMDLEDVR